MANTIKLRRSAQSGSVPTTSQLGLGELAMNTYDGKLFFKTNQGGTEAIVEVGSSGSGSGGGSTITIASATPSVANSTVGDIYWDSDEGNPYILYDDGNGTAQWVALVATAAGTPADTEKLIEGNTEAEVVDTGSDGHFKVTTEGTERIRVGPAGQIGIAGTNYGTSGQVLTSGGASGAISWADASDSDKISEGNTEAEVVDTGSDGHFKVTTEGTERVRVGPSGQIGIAGANYGTSGQVLTSGGASGAVAWADASGGGATGGGTDKVFIENKLTIDTDYTIGTNIGGSGSVGTGASCVGPIAVAAGITLTVPSNARLVVL